MFCVYYGLKQPFKYVTYCSVKKENLHKDPLPTPVRYSPKHRAACRRPVAQLLIAGPRQGHGGCRGPSTSAPLLPCAETAGLGYSHPLAPEHPHLPSAVSLAPSLLLFHFAQS